jgi:hypothetical protein
LVGGREESFGAQAKLSPILEVQIFWQASVIDWHWDWP